MSKVTNTISALTGAETIPGSLMSVQFAVEITIVGMRPSTSRKFTAARGLFDHVGGALYDNSYNIPDGQIMALRAMRTVGGRATTKRAKVRVDHRAPYQRLSVATSGHERSVTPHMYIEGHFWLLPEEEAKKGVSPLYAPSYADAQTMFTLTEMHPGATMPVIEEKTVTIDGEEKKITVTKSKRRMRL